MITPSRLARGPTFEKTEFAGDSPLQEDGRTSSTRAQSIWLSPLLCRPITSGRVGVPQNKSQMAEVAVSQLMFRDILMLIVRLRAPPVSASEVARIECEKQRWQECAMTRHSNKISAGRGGNLSISAARDTHRGWGFSLWTPKNRNWPVPHSEEKLFPKCDLPHTSQPIPEPSSLRVGGSGRSSGECQINRNRRLQCLATAQSGTISGL
jgi:hypothetical protein